MTNTEKVFLGVFLSIVLGLLVGPFGLPEGMLSETMLDKAFCSPWECGGLGRGENGIDLLAHTLGAAQTAVILALVVVLSTMVLGIPLGIFSSLTTPLGDQGVVLLTNLFLSFPSILLAIALSAFVGQGFWSTWAILCVTGWAPFCRLSRGAAMQINNQEYVLAARSIGCHSLRLALKHVFPNILPLMVVQAAFQLAAIIIVESTLSFLGLGLPQETPSLGRLIYGGKQQLLWHPHAALIPGAFVLLLTMGFYVAGMILERRWSGNRRGV